MHKTDIKLVQQSMEVILTNAQVIGGQLYHNLFKIAPHTRQLFVSDLASQSRKLMSILIHITANLDQMDLLEEELTELAIKHEHYRIVPAHYELLGQALFMTLEDALGDQWNVDTAKAWKNAYDTIADNMIKIQAVYAKKQTE